MQTYITLQGTIHVYGCARVTCHGLIALTDQYVEHARRTHESFYCTAGHSQSFPGKSKEEMEIERLRNEKAQSDRLRMETERKLADLETKHLATTRKLLTQERTTRRAVKVASKLVAEKRPKKARAKTAVRKGAK